MAVAALPSVKVPELAVKLVKPLHVVVGANVVYFASQPSSVPVALVVNLTNIAFPLLFTVLGNVLPEKVFRTCAEVVVPS